MKYTSIKNNDSSYGEGVRVSLFVSGYGERFDSSVADKIIEMVSEPTISGLSILGYDPLYQDTNDLILLSMLCNRVRLKGKTVWLWTELTWEDVFSLPCRNIQHQYQKFLVADCNVVVDGLFSRRTIDVQASLRTGSVVTYQN